MSLEIHAPKADALARGLAATGEDIDTAVVRAIEERLARVPRRPGAGQDAAIEALFERLARLPVLDRRSPDGTVKANKYRPFSVRIRPSASAIHEQKQWSSTPP